MRRALEVTPGSLRSVAMEARVSSRLLTMILAGQRTATPRVMAKVADALERLGTRHLEAARILRDALAHEEVKSWPAHQ
ncbi:MAG TPA: hypothetical protein VLH75_12445 [Longimicrobiales bacterium]|nr:hypothetical protein [Longimicrobiales bacterium]